jgi:predicted ester cyclase
MRYLSLYDLFVFLMKQEPLMTITRAQMDQKIDEHFDFEARDDVNGVLATLAADVEHDIVGWPAGPAHDRAGARQFYEALFADLSDGRVECLRRLYGDNFVVDESRWHGKATGRPFGLEGHGRALAFRMLHLLEFSSDGQIKRENVWIDLAAIQRQLPQD